MATHLQINQQMELMLKELNEQRRLSWMASQGFNNVQFRLVGGVTWFDCHADDDVKFAADSIVYRIKETK